MIRFASDPESAPAETERIGDEIAELASHIHAATYRLLVLLREFEDRGGWGGGFRSCAHWLSWRTGIGLGTAREKVRVARALPDLPEISQAMERGELSFSKVRALTRVATAANEAELLGFARHGTTSHLERLVRAWRSVDRVEEGRLERARHEARSLTLFPDDDGSWILRARLDPEVGAVLKKALDAAADELYQKGERETLHRQRHADAIGIVAERALAHEGDVRRADRFQVVMHVEARPPSREAGPLAPETGPLALETGTASETTSGTGASSPPPDRGHAVLAESGHRVSAETSRRLSCDASRVRMTHDHGGAVLDVGRRSRTVPPAIRRALEYRDRTCRFPACGVRHTDAHHLRHWADGGETRLDNLVLLCRRHHRAVHEGEVRVEVVEEDAGAGAAAAGADPDAASVRGVGALAGVGRRPRIRFIHPGGWTIPDAPPPPPLSPSPTADLIRTHRDLGISPDAWTATPRWQGESLDLGYAIDVLRR